MTVGDEGEAERSVRRTQEARLLLGPSEAPEPAPLSELLL